MRTVFLVAVLCGCRERVAPPPDAGAAEPPPSHSVPYDCGFVSIEPASCAPSPEWVAEIDRLGSLFIEPGEGDPPEEHCRLTAAALDRALAADLSQLTALERIVAQNGALRAVGPRSCDRRSAGGVSQKAAQVVLRLALPARAISELGSDPFADLEEWIGPRSSWIDRKGHHTELTHDIMEFYTQAFRPVRSGSMRAVISQMVAIDTDWRVHVTPIVGRIELREDLRIDAPACIGKIDSTKLRCDRGRLRPVPEDRLPHNTFVQSSGPGLVDCNRCHGVPEADANLVDLLESERGQLTERRARFLSEAELAIRSIRRKLP